MYVLVMFFYNFMHTRMNTVNVFVEYETRQDLLHSDMLCISER